MLLKTVFTPGPTQVPQAVLDAVVKFNTYHRSEDFKLLYDRLTGKLKKLLHTEHNLNVITSSGTGAMECAVVNFCDPGEKVIYVNQGVFGKRWGEICIAFGLNAAEVFVEPGSALTPDVLKKAGLDGVTAVFLTHCETSTGTISDISKLSEHIKNNSDALVIVDAITSIGAVEFRMDDWGIDAAVSASQKGLMCPPGISVVAYNQAAKGKMLKSTAKRFYFNLIKELDFQRSKGFTAWTPAVGLFHGLETSVDMILGEGLQNHWSRVQKMAEYFRNASVQEGFGLFSKKPADSLTALAMPGNIPSDFLIKRLKDRHGVQVANGQGELKGKIIRVSHMGDLTLEDLKELMEIIREELVSLQNEKK